MKKIINISLAICLFVTGCKKEQASVSTLVSLTLVNAAVNSPAIKLAGYNNEVEYGYSSNITLNAGNTNLYVYPSTDSLLAYLNVKIPTSDGDIYSLYLAGQIPNVESLLVKESNVPRPTDSLISVRFVNLLQGGIPLSINLQGRNDGSELGNLTYKSISFFKDYSAKKLPDELTRTFEIRNANSGALLSTYTISGTSITSGIPRFHSITLVISGDVNGSPYLDVTRVNNF